MRYHVTTTIPYVNARPHLGFALELVQADVLARHRRRQGDRVRFLTGTDDNSLKNVLAAAAEGVPIRELVDRNASAFEALRDPLRLSTDDFIRTSRDPRHRPGVERLWRACAANGDELIHSGRLRIEPAARRNEVLSFVAAGLTDISVSRSHTRSRGWGIPVPDDPDQTIYVWWDALGNYLTADREWWAGSDRRVHLLGKGVLRFHAVYWPAMLLSAGEPLPTDLFVHDYLTVDGEKISKSSGRAVDPVALVERFGVDAVRWWLLREVPRVGDADFTVEKLVARADGDLAGGLGNLVSRVVTMVHRFRDGEVPPAGTVELDACARAPERIAEALDNVDFRAATAAVWTVVDGANRHIDRTRPWQLPPTEHDAALDVLLRACRTLADLLRPFLPDAADGLAERCTPVRGRLPAPRPLFPRIAPTATRATGAGTPRGRCAEG